LHIYTRICIREGVKKGERERERERVQRHCQYCRPGFIAAPKGTAKEPLN